MMNDNNNLTLNQSATLHTAVYAAHTESMMNDNNNLTLNQSATSHTAVYAAHTGERRGKSSGVPFDKQLPQAHDQPLSTSSLSSSSSSSAAAKGVPSAALRDVTPSYGQSDTHVPSVFFANPSIVAQKKRSSAPMPGNDNGDNGVPDNDESDLFGDEGGGGVESGRRCERSCVFIFVFSFVFLLKFLLKCCECSCDFHLCFLHSALANVMNNM
jgi:hypothetical protein